MDLKKILKDIPLSSGVYLMKDRQGKILYIGKAVSLRKRVQSYFRANRGRLSKTDFLVSEVNRIDHLSTDSEAEALILEASLIKKFRPKYNVDLKDDKSYPFIQITDDLFPRITIVRPRNKLSLQANDRIFGPYVDSRLIREALIIIRRIFHFRTCRVLPSKECLDLHLGLCDGPCIKKIDPKTYCDIVRHVILVLEGRKDDLYRQLRKQMERFAAQKEYEKAAMIRNQIQAIGALYSGTKDVNYFKEGEQLQRALGLEKRPERIEAFDISHTMGQQATGSMVSFFNGKADKSRYRRFRIQSIDGIDDFRMMAEVIFRRYSRLKKDGMLFPDLILVDGGKGQLSAAQGELKKLHLTIPLAALAKKQEEIFISHRRHPIVLDKNSLGLKLIQRIRDEAHRFALGYHRALRTKKVFDE